MLKDIFQIIVCCILMVTVVYCSNYGYYENVKELKEGNCTEATTLVALELDDTYEVDCGDYFCRVCKIESIDSINFKLFPIEED